MRVGVYVSMLAILVGLAGPARSQEKAANSNPIDQIAWLMGGRWTADGDKGPDGKPFHVESRFSWAENHRGLMFTTWFLIDGKLVPVYQGMYAWNPARKKFNFLYTDNEGSMTEGEATWADKSLEQEFQIVNPDGTAHTFRSTVTHTAPDAYDWNVRGQNKEGKWVVMFGLTYKR